MNYNRHAILQVDLNALTENISFFRRKLKPETKLMAMVKADAYGIGATEVSKQLVKSNIDYLAVAYTEEAIELREAGITHPILVMNTAQDGYDRLISINAEPSIFNFRTLNLFTEKLIENKIQQAYPIHLKLNTGMNRLGFDRKDLHDLITELADNPYVKVASVFSHFAVSDEPMENDFTAFQFKNFNEFYDKISFNLGYKPLKHIANTAAVFRLPEYQLDMVRLGIGMYGVSPSLERQQDLKTVVTLKSFITQIRKINKGESVSYGRNFKADKDSKIAVVSIGYADGLHRILSNENGYVFINGKKTPIIGSICMDMFMANVSDVDCKEGDEVIIFGENPSVYELANQAKTIPYEIITSVAPRVKRVYLNK
ncbi:alanine racemase [Weeksellaceae bacterium TAE3-ERU29]|nr:alanine racemase [Weeksellaceae bacterium TAE3-ERU29]